MKGVRLIKCGRGYRYALIDSGQILSAPVAVQLLQSDDIGKKKIAIGHLGRLGQFQYLYPLLNDSDPGIRYDTVVAIGRNKGSDMSKLIKMVSDPVEGIRNKAIKLLWNRKQDIQGLIKEVAHDMRHDPASFEFDEFINYLQRSAKKKN